MMDEGKFNTYVPLPTASKDNAKYDPNKYWRGPVWLDQALYGIEALQNYGYNEEAKDLTIKLFDHSKGLTGDGPIHENYNPETGEGLHTKNFSWSASAFYLLYQNTLTSTQTTSQNGLAIPESEIEVVVNKDLLYKLIKEAEAFNESEFTSDSYKGLVIALENGKKVYDDKNATQQQVDDAATALKNSINALVKNETSKNPGDNKVPVTGDNVNVLPYVAALGLAGLGAVVYKKKKED